MLNITRLLVRPPHGKDAEALTETLFAMAAPRRAWLGCLPIHRVVNSDAIAGW